MRKGCFSVLIMCYYSSYFKMRGVCANGGEYFGDFGECKTYIQRMDGKDLVLFMKCFVA